MTVKKNQTQTGGERPREEVLVITSEFRELERVREFVRGFCRRADSGSPGRDRICDIELVATEVLTNIMRHAYRGAGDRDIHIRVHLEGDFLVLTVHDWGHPFDPDEVPPPDFDGSRTGGFGLYIVGQLVDELEFTRDESGRNRTRLKMNLRKQNTLE
jgi:anti-sigma regulatory factor (Ser/Thr protein kinase)